MLTRLLLTILRNIAKIRRFLLRLSLSWQKTAIFEAYYVMSSIVVDADICLSCAWSLTVKLNQEW